MLSVARILGRHHHAANIRHQYPTPKMSYASSLSKQLGLCMKDTIGHASFDDFATCNVMRSKYAHLKPRGVATGPLGSNSAERPHPKISSPYPVPVPTAHPVASAPFVLGLCRLHLSSARFFCARAHGCCEERGSVCRHSLSRRSHLSSQQN